MASAARLDARPGVVACWICAVAFFGLTSLAAAKHYLPGEQAALAMIVAGRIPWLDLPAQILSFLGSANFILPFWLALAVWRGLARDRPALLRLLPLPLGYLLYLGIKSIIARPGPSPDVFPWLYDLSPGYFLESLLHRQLQSLPAQGVSLPVAAPAITAASVTLVTEQGYVCGHALMAALVYGTTAKLCWDRAGGRALLFAAGWVSLSLAILVGLARIYMAVHFPSDVLGAWLLAVVVLILIDGSVDRIWRKLARPASPAPGLPATRP